jgi:acyl-CoA thioester hydrolase
VTGAPSSQPTSGRIEGGRHLLPLRVYYEDTDAQGIVYYANWLRFLERGRTEMLRLLGQEHSALRLELGLNWVVRRCLIDYLKPGRLDETIEIVTRCGALRGASLDMLQEATRGGETLVRAELLVACMGADGRPARLPPAVRIALGEVAADPADVREAPRSRHIRV